MNVGVKVQCLTAWLLGNIDIVRLSEPSSVLFRFVKGINNVYKDIVKDYILEWCTRLELAKPDLEGQCYTNLANTTYSISPNLTENGELANLSTYGLVRLACKALLT